LGVIDDQGESLIERTNTEQERWCLQCWGPKLHHLHL